MAGGGWLAVQRGGVSGSEMVRLRTMTDRTTKILLALIALGLLANAITPLLRPAPVAAADSFSCDGKLDASPFGVTYPGGYSINIDCK